jgi:iron complex outermembrane receptor protein
MPLGDQLSVHAGARYDANHFSVADHLLSDGDASGARTMTAASGDGGIAWRAGSAVTVWSNIGTVFETPTTTELANQPSGAGGFNPDLGPQRSVTEEVGARGVLRAFTFDAAVYHTITHDAIVPYNEVGGRTYYDNAGAMRTRGAELGITWAVRRRLALLATWTFTDAIYTDYLVVNPTSVDTLDGHQLAGLPRTVARVGLRGDVGGGFTVDVDQGFASGMFGDDDNTIRVAGWGAGVTGARLSWQGLVGGWPVAPFAAVLNAFDRRYVGSVTTNGAGGRVFEPSAGRTIYLGMSITAQGT